MVGNVGRGVTATQDDRSASTQIPFDKGQVPADFPIAAWTEQSERYQEYLRWHSGAALAESKFTDENGDPLLKYPLHVNSVRNFARKLGGLLMGEASDSPTPLVKCLAKPKQPLTGDTLSEDDQKLAKLVENVVNEVWNASSGRAIQMESAIMSQPLGGSVFKVEYVPKDLDLVIPIRIRYIRPDYFLPVWGTDDWDLEGAWLIYNISAQTAASDFGVDTKGNNTGIYLYVEHWTKKSYTVTVNGKPVIERIRDINPLTGTEQVIEVEMKDVPNIFGFVPFVYVPRYREGTRLGPSVVDDITGLLTEYNSRLADTGDAMLKAVDRHRFMSNVYIDPQEREIAPGLNVIDLGQTPPMSKDAPAIKTEEAPALSDALVNWPNNIWNQLLREASLGPIAFGEDEGSQRSALTLAFRMWPATVNTRMQRTFWGEGFNRVNWMILRMLIKRPVEGINIPPDVKKRLELAPDWAPQIPRDREQLVNEVTLRLQSGSMSLETALEQYGDVRNTDEEIKRIKDFMEFKASLQSAGQTDKPGTTLGSGAPTKIQAPVADSGLSEKQ
jgi:hypothetical protein